MRGNSEISLSIVFYNSILDCNYFDFLSALYIEAYDLTINLTTLSLTQVKTWAVTATYVFLTFLQ